MNKKLKKWNPKTRVYEDYEVPIDWLVSCYESEMDSKVNCCQCGMVMSFGEGYTSIEVHTEHGFGYCVCEKCYDDEWERKADNCI